VIIYPALIKAVWLVNTENAHRLQGAAMAGIYASRWQMRPSSKMQQATRAKTAKAERQTK